MSNGKKIWDYFEETVDYPNFKAHDILPYGTLWCYVSSTFLNGFINYVKPLKVYQLDRYTAEDDKIQVDYRTPENWNVARGFDGTKAEFRELILSGKAKMIHTRLNVFDDDIIILGEIEHEEGDNLNRFMIFWFDCDVSDCKIGRFSTTDSIEEVARSITDALYEEREESKEWNQGRDNGVFNYHELPLSFLEGWIKF